MRVLARPICAVKAVFFDVKVNALRFRLSKSYFHDLHFHPVVTDPCEKPEKVADRRVSQIVVAQHIAATCDLQTAVPRADFLGGIRNRKICPHILDFCSLKPCFLRSSLPPSDWQHQRPAHCRGKRPPSPAPVPGPAGSESNRTPRRQRTPPRGRHRFC